MSTPTPPRPAWDVAHVLAEPTRREIYDAVRKARGSVSRDDIARQTGINRRLAAFHLERLAAAGLLDTHYARPAGRAGGPGAGRPAKRYAAADVELDLTLPPRHYDLAARLLANAITTAPHDAAAAAETVAFDEGARVGNLRRPKSSRQGSSELSAALVDLGYEPTTEDKTVRLCNCPFRLVADTAPGLVCRMNHALVRGLLTGLGLDPGRATLEPQPPNCCVTVAARQSSGGGADRVG